MVQIFLVSGLSILACGLRIYYIFKYFGLWSKYFALWLKDYNILKHFDLWSKHFGLWPKELYYS
jgi:hypothetical protein